MSAQGDSSTLRSIDGGATLRRRRSESGRVLMVTVPLQEGDLVDDKYAVYGVLGRGGMGFVYRARDVRSGHEVAIKVLHPALSHDELVVRRFQREAVAAGRVASEHCVAVLDVGTFAGGEHYLVMEYLEGDTLSARLKRVGTMTPRELHGIAEQLLEGLETAHAAGIIHRDLKPGNVFLVRRQRQPDLVKILDFGVSKLSATASDMTHTGAVLGTPQYMAPEQIRGARHADPRSDVYSTGVILFKALTGRTPFACTSIFELINKLLYDEPPLLTDLAPGIDAGFAAIVHQALERDPNHRFATAGAFLEALRAWRDSAPSSGRLPADETLPFARHAAPQSPDSPTRMSSRRRRVVHARLLVLLAIVAVLLFGARHVPPSQRLSAAMNIPDAPTPPRIVHAVVSTMQQEPEPPRAPERPLRPRRFTMHRLPTPSPPDAPRVGAVSF